MAEREGFELPPRLKLSRVSDADLVLMLLVKNDYHCAGECGSVKQKTPGHMRVGQPKDNLNELMFPRVCRRY